MTTCEAAHAGSACGGYRCPNCQRKSDNPFRCPCGAGEANHVLLIVAEPAGHAATYAPDPAGGLTVTCPHGCGLGTSAHQDDELGAQRRVELHRLSTVPLRPVPHGEYMRIPYAVSCRKCKLNLERVGGGSGMWVVADTGTTADGLSFCPPDPDARKVPGSHQPSPVTTRRTLHEHRRDGQRLVHDHPGGDLPHGYFQHPEDPR